MRHSNHRWGLPSRPWNACLCLGPQVLPPHLRAGSFGEMASHTPWVKRGLHLDAPISKGQCMLAVIWHPVPPHRLKVFIQA